MTPVLSSWWQFGGGGTSSEVGDPGRKGLSGGPQHFGRVECGMRADSPGEASRVQWVCNMCCEVLACESLSCGCCHGGETAETHQESVHSGQGGRSWA